MNNRADYTNEIKSIVSKIPLGDKDPIPMSHVFHRLLKIRSDYQGEHFKTSIEKLVEEGFLRASENGDYFLG